MIMGRKMGVLAGLSLLMAVTSGCSEEVEPGDYVVYRIGSTQQTLNGDCQPGPNEVQDSTSIRSSGTVILFAGQEGEFFLETADATLSGELGGEPDSGVSYAFEGQTVDVEYADPKGTGTKRVVTINTEIDLDVDGEVVSGDQRITTTFQCTGSDCGVVPGRCTQRTSFNGTEVEDVGLEHKVE
jgi:hypothetical protein